MKNEGAPRIRFLRHDGIYRSDVSSHLVNLVRSTAFRSGPGQAIGRAGRKHALPIVAMSSGRLFLNGVAVGMPVTQHPPHRSVLAELPHTALPLDSGVKTNIRIRMKSTRARNPPVKDRPKLFPIRLPSLTTAA